jgi:hypothetical protein
MATPSFEHGLDLLIDLWVEAALRRMEAERASTGERVTTHAVNPKKTRPVQQHAGALGD